MKMILRPYSEARDEILHGDMLLFRRQPGDVGGRVIATVGRSPYSHAALAAWIQNNLFVLEQVAWIGGRAVLLSYRVSEAAGRIDVYRHWNAQLYHGEMFRAVGAMLREVGRPYGRWALYRVALLHTPVIRWFVRAIFDDEVNGGPRFCSGAVSHAYRAGGMDPVPNLADGHTEPGDLGRSAMFTYQFTLTEG